LSNPGLDALHPLDRGLHGFHALPSGAGGLSRITADSLGISGDLLDGSSDLRRDGRGSPYCNSLILRPPSHPINSARHLLNRRSRAVDALGLLGVAGSNLLDGGRYLSRSFASLGGCL